MPKKLWLVQQKVDVTIILSHPALQGCIEYNYFWKYLYLQKTQWQGAFICLTFTWKTHPNIESVKASLTNRKLHALPKKKDQILFLEIWSISNSPGPEHILIILAPYVLYQKSNLTSNTRPISTIHENTFKFKIGWKQNINEQLKDWVW